MPVFLRGTNPDVYVMYFDEEVRASQGLLASLNRESLLGVGSAPVKNVRQNQPQVDARAHATNSPHQGNPKETLDKRQDHASAPLHLPASVFGTI